MYYHIAGTVTDIEPYAAVIDCAGVGYLLNASLNTIARLKTGERAKLYVSEVFATPGPIIKRIMPRAQGRAYRINKRTSHVTLAVAEKE